RIGHRSLQKAVVHYPQLCTGRAKPISQLAELIDVHPLVIGDEQKRRPIQFLDEIRNDAGFFRSHEITRLGMAMDQCERRGTLSRLTSSLPHTVPWPLPAALGPPLQSLHSHSPPTDSQQMKIFRPVPRHSHSYPA